jgi:hypothetical protein
VCVFVTMVTFLPSHCLARIGGFLSSHTYIHTLRFISQVQTDGHKNRHIKTKQAPVNKIIKTNFLCFAPHIRELYKKNYL